VLGICAYPNIGSVAEHSDLVVIGKVNGYIVPENVAIQSVVRKMGFHVSYAQEETK